MTKSTGKRPYQPKPNLLSVHQSQQYADIVFGLRSDGRVVRKIGAARRWELTSIPASYALALPRIVT